MRRFWAAMLAFVLPVTPVRSAVALVSTDVPHISTGSDDDLEVPRDAETSEETGIIPKNAEGAAAAQPITPLTQFPEKDPYEQAVGELEQALSLAKAGDHEAASDLALEAYDDLRQIHIRRPRRKRAKLRAQRYQAAQLYMQVSIAYIRDFLKETGKTPAALAEGKARLWDLKDVAHDYPDLLRWLGRLADEYPASVLQSKY